MKQKLTLYTSARRKRYAARLREEIAKPLPVCAHVKTQVVAVPASEGRRDTVIDGEDQRRCANRLCGAFMGLAV